MYNIPWLFPNALLLKILLVYLSNLVTLYVQVQLLLFVGCCLHCEAGYTVDNATCTCSLSNICQLGPCRNGGSCTLVSAPSNYTCDCTTGYKGVNCTDCKPGYSCCKYC